MTREEAIKMLKSKMDGHTDTSYEWAETVRMAIEALEQTTWIPVSERLPKVVDCYVVTRKIESNLIVDACFFERPNIWHSDIRINRERNRLTDIVAWMSLPEPYKDKESEEV